MDKAFTFDDVLLIPQLSEINSRKDVSLKVKDQMGKLTLDLPVFSSNMDTITGSEMTKFMRSVGGMGVLHRFMTIEKNVTEYKKNTDCIVSVGNATNEWERFKALLDSGADKFCVDVAHGHSFATGETVRKIRKAAPGALIIAGNVCTLSGAEYLADEGADIIKIGIGPSPVCRTRGATGFGYPQLSAIRECCHVKRSIIADGGMASPGDIVKALAFGADFVMLGSMLAGTYFTPGEVTYTENSGPNGPVKRYRGMASREANEDMFGKLASHKTYEGVSITVPYKDLTATREVIQDIEGGLRSGLTYSGARTISELQSKSEYVFVTDATRKENTHK